MRGGGTTGAPAARTTGWRARYRFFGGSHREISQIPAHVHRHRADRRDTRLARRGGGQRRPGRGGGGPFTCSGTPRSPGVLAGRFSSVVVVGTCVVNACPASVRGNVVVTPGSVLLAAFALNDTTHSGTSSLAVGGNLVVRFGGTLIMGCSAAHFACIDDPSQKHPTLNSSSSVGGSLVGPRRPGRRGAQQLHRRQRARAGRWRRPDLHARPGSSGSSSRRSTATTRTTGSAAAWPSPACGRAGSAHCATTCSTRSWPWATGWPTRTPTSWSATSSAAACACFRNFPAVQFGDSHGVPNLVGRFAIGQCGFRVLKPNPAPNGPLTPISVPARTTCRAGGPDRLTPLSPARPGQDLCPGRAEDNGRPAGP